MKRFVCLLILVTIFLSGMSYAQPEFHNLELQKLEIITNNPHIVEAFVRDLSNNFEFQDEEVEAYYNLLSSQRVFSLNYTTFIPLLKDEEKEVGIAHIVGNQPTYPGFTFFKKLSGDFVKISPAANRWCLYIVDKKTPTPYPTYTPLPTHTPFPTWTPAPTETPFDGVCYTYTPTPTPTLTPTPTAGTPATWCDGEPPRWLVICVMAISLESGEVLDLLWNGGTVVGHLTTDQQNQLLADAAFAPDPTYGVWYQWMWDDYRIPDPLSGTFCPSQSGMHPIWYCDFPSPPILPFHEGGQIPLPFWLDWETVLQPQPVGPIVLPNN